MDTEIKLAGKTFIPSDNFPLPGSAEERNLFNDLQEGFKKQFEIIFPDKLAPRTVAL